MSQSEHRGASDTDGGAAGGAIDSEYAIVRVDSAESRKRWDSFVQASPEANPFSDPAFLDAMTQATGCQCDIWVAVKGDAWQAGAAVFYLSGPGGKQCVHPPLTAYKPVLFYPQLRSKSYPSKITHEFLAITRFLNKALSQQYWNISQVLLPDTDDIRPWVWEGWKAQPHYTYLLDVTQEMKLSPSVRKHARKCVDAGFKISLDWAPEEFWRLFQLTMERQSIDVALKQEEFYGLAEALRQAGLAWMVTAISPQGVAASSRIELALPKSTRVYDWAAGNDPAFFTSGVSSWLMTKAAERIKELGFKQWDLCGADNESVAKFKSELGGRLTPYFMVDGPRTLTGDAYTLVRSMGSRLKRTVAGIIKRE